ncbi:MAG: elongation factor Ts, partial [Bacteroidales bacterium]|nr:elongation factor Ts [Bacteroidales bacterium]
PSHVDSEDHIESKMAKGWISAEDAAKAREIKAQVTAEKTAGLGAEEAKIQNIAKGRLGKFFKENTLVEQVYQMGDGKQTVKDFLASVDKDVKVVAFKRFSLND